MGGNIKKLSNKDAFVVDASFILAFLLPDEKNEEVDKIFQGYKKGQIDLTSSQLLNFEVLNALRSGVLKRRIDKNMATRLAKEFLRLKIVEVEVDYIKTLKFSLKEAISYYDSTYLVLSKTSKLSLLTLDKELMKRLKE